jgi:hypothetical protein
VAARGKLKSVHATTPPSTGATVPAEATKEELQRQMEAARESLSETVGQIRETVEEQYASVKAGVSGVLDWREGFQQEPLLWSVGALAAGFAVGYTLGVAEKRNRRGKSPALSAFADGLIDELRNAGRRLPLPSLDPKTRALFGFEISRVLAEIGSEKPPRVRSRAAKKKRRSR